MVKYIPVLFLNFKSVCKQYSALFLEGFFLIISKATKNSILYSG
jgi:hypothetical protein